MFSFHLIKPTVIIPLIQGDWVPSIITNGLGGPAEPRFMNAAPFLTSTRYLPEQVHTARYAGSANGRGTRCVSGTTALTLRDGRSGFIVT